MYANLVFSMGVVIYILYKNMQGSVAENAITMSYFSIITTVGSYVFGAAWQDISTVKVHGSVQQSKSYDRAYSRMTGSSRLDNPDEGM